MDKLGLLQTKDHIAEILRKEIFAGRISEGDELLQEQLAQSLEVSRMPVREAIQILEIEGLVVRLPNRHVKVIGLNGRTACEVMRAIAALEVEIAILLMESCNLPKDQDPHDDAQFHNRFSLQLGNHYLRQTHQRLLAVYPQYARSHCADKALLAEQNELIKNALDNYNVEAVRAGIRKYYDLLSNVFTVEKE